MKSTRLSAKRFLSFAVLSVANVGILAATLDSPVSAHEGRDVGDYNLVVGFLKRTRI